MCLRRWSFAKASPLPLIRSRLTLIEISSSITGSISFNLKAVSSKTFILLLAHERPRSLVSGSPINLAAVLSTYNRNEFHHLYPQAFLRRLDIPTEKQSCLANMCFISAADNKTLGGLAPSEYRNRMVRVTLPDVLRRAAVPDDILFTDSFEWFVEQRADLLVELAWKRLAYDESPGREPKAEREDRERY